MLTGPFGILFDIYLIKSSSKGTEDIQMSTINVELQLLTESAPVTE